jgi:hypothetical protein
MQRLARCVWLYQWNSLHSVAPTGFYTQAAHYCSTQVALEPHEAIFQTVLYADIFDYPLTQSEIHHFLISTPAAPETVQAAFENSAWLQSRLCVTRGYVTVRGRQSIAAVRDERQRSSAQLWPAARRWATVIGWLPFVRMVAVTGALAVDNAPAGDDIDYLIVTVPGRVWLARALAVTVVRLARLLRVGLCPNYVLAYTALSQQRRNLNIAHDLAQMVPLVGHRVYAEMRAANQWAGDYLPQARRPLRAEPELRLNGWQAALQRCGEWLLGGRLGDALEGWERDRKLRKFAPAAGQASSAAELDADRVKGHFDDHGYPILRKFHERVAQYLPERGDSSVRDSRVAVVEEAAD